MAVASSLVFLVAGAVFTVIGLTSPAGGPWLVLAALFLPFGLLNGLLLWFLLQPPVLKADALEVSCRSPASRQRMPRSELALIFRGQAFGAGRVATWLPSYLFVARNGGIGMSVPSFRFSAEGVDAFAERLGVPIRGDWSRMVGDRIDPAST